MAVTLATAALAAVGSRVLMERWRPPMARLVALVASDLVLARADDWWMLGLGVALKMDDGNNARAAEVALAAVLQPVMRAEGADEAFLQTVSDARMVNWNGIEVGRLRAAQALHAAA